MACESRTSFTSNPCFARSSSRSESLADGLVTSRTRCATCWRLMASDIISVISSSNTRRCSGSFGSKSTAETMCGICKATHPMNFRSSGDALQRLHAQAPIADRLNAKKATCSTNNCVLTPAVSSSAYARGAPTHTWTSAAISKAIFPSQCSAGLLCFELLRPVLLSTVLLHSWAFAPCAA